MTYEYLNKSRRILQLFFRAGEARGEGSNGRLGGFYGGFRSSGVSGATNQAVFRGGETFFLFESSELIVDSEGCRFDSLFIAGGFIEGEDLA